MKAFFEKKEEIKNSNYKQTINKTMLSYCLRCRTNTECKNTKVVRIKTERRMLLSKCKVCNSKKSNFIKEQEAK